MAGYIGSATAVVSNGGEKKVTVTASGGQTAISNVSYAPGQVDVYHNGVRLVDGTDYTATNGTSITLTVAAAANDQIVVRSFNTFQVSDNVSASGGGSFAADVTFATGADIITSSLGTSNFRAGVNAGNSITSGGNYNVAVGDEAGTAITTGDNNVAVGYLSLDALTTASSNVSIGAQALSVNILGSLSTAVGYSSLENQNYTTATDSHNTAVGFKAGHNVTTGTRNTLIGSLAGDALTDADFNVALGVSALTTDTLGSRTTAIGTNALFSQNFTSATDTFNTAVGFEAGSAVQTGVQNTLMGGLAGGAMTTGSRNTFMGIGAGSAGVVTGNDNTAVGASTGANITSGSNLMCLGHDAGLSGSPGGAFTTGSNALVLGDENIAACHIQTDWTVASDQRDKTDFTALDLGLDFVKALAPVTYKWDKRSKYGDKTAADYELLDQTPDGTHKEDWLDVGFKAQEVEALEQAAGYNKSNKTNLMSSHTNDGKQMGLQYSKFVPILVKAIQEQNALIVALTARVATLEG